MSLFDKRAIFLPTQPAISTNKQDLSQQEYIHLFTITSLQQTEPLKRFCKVKKKLKKLSLSQSLSH